MKCIVMLGTDFSTKGGISSVVSTYRAAGLFDRFGITYVATHCDGSRTTKFGALVKAWFRFAVLIANGKVGAVHAHMSSGASFWRKTLFYMPCFVLKIPVILHLHSGGFIDFFERRVPKFLKPFVKWVFCRCHTVIVLSVERRRWIADNFGCARVLVLFNPVALPVMAPIDFSHRADQILCLGRLGQNKGSYDLIDALLALRTLGFDVSLRLGGDGELEKVREYADVCGVGRHVHLLGWVTGGTKQSELAAARIYALPSYHEAMPVSLLEAMAAGLPVVSTRVGGIPDVVDDEVDGLLIDAGDVKALTAALARLISDDKLAMQLSHAARNKIESRFSVVAVLPALESIYRDLGFVPLNTGQFVDRLDS